MVKVFGEGHARIQRGAFASERTLRATTGLCSIGLLELAHCAHTIGYAARNSPGRRPRCFGRRLRCFGRCSRCRLGRCSRCRLGRCVTDSQIESRIEGVWIRCDDDPWRVRERGLVRAGKE
jgi:hypothetical protein